MKTSSHQDFFYGIEQMGTTIMAVTYDGGVIACADSRTSISGVYVADRASDKIDYLHQKIFALRTGTASMTSMANHKARIKISQHSTELGKLPHVKTAAKETYQKQLSAGFIIAGWDPYDGAQVFTINLGGACLKMPFAISGSGSGYIYGFVDANYRQNMSFQQARKFCINAVSLAMSRDGSSGGLIRLMNIHKDGLGRQVIDPKDLPFK